MHITNNQAISGLCFIIPAFILVIPVLAVEVVFPILVLYSLIYCYQQKINPLKYAPTCFLSYLCLLFFSASLLSILFSDISLYALKRLAKNYHFLVAPFLTVFLYQHVNRGQLKLSIKIGALLAGIIALWQSFHLGIRAHGSVNAILFSDMALLLAFFSLLDIWKESKQHKWLSVTSFIFGIIAVILSLSRGAWITVPVLLIALIFIWHKQQQISTKTISILLLVGFLSIGTLSLTPQVQTRFQGMQHDLAIYKTNSLTSVGMRLTLWDAARTLIPERPIVGFGMHNIKNVLTLYFQDKPDLMRLNHFGHFHNEYLTTWVLKGAIGELTLIALLFSPIYIFYKRISPKLDNYFSGLGILLCSGYAFFAITNLVFGHGIIDTFFVFFLAVTSHSFDSNRFSTPHND